jgi:hypothetical protein
MRIVIHVTKSIIPRLILLGIFIGILILVIGYARGYRFDLDQGKVKSTGILSVNSTPKAAKVYVNGKLEGASDINLTLPHGNYKVEVKKDGYTDWSKDVSLKGEIVISLDAKLFSKNTSLTPLTTLGVVKAVPVGPNGKILLFTQTGDPEKDGLYMFQASKNAISLFPPLNPILLKALIPLEVDLQKATIDFSPDYKEAILTFQLADEQEVSYLLDLSIENTGSFDITTSKKIVLAKWDEEKNKEIYKIIESLPKKMVPLATESFEVISLSPDEKRLMYRAKNDATLPIIINPPLIGANQTPESRSIEKGSIYIYDKKEDKNFKVPREIEILEPDPADVISLEIDQTLGIEPTLSDATDSAIAQIPLVWNRSVVDQVSAQIQWYPTSDYIAIKQKNQIILMQYDGTNKEIVYAGPFSTDFFIISPDWNLLVLINLNPEVNTYGDLYSVGLR